MKDYATAARILGGVVETAPENVAARLPPARAYYHSAQLTRVEAELRAGSSSRTPSGRTPTSCWAAPWSG
ncbi:hypothetical protein GCM10010381_02020 [Streptomyces xantholiticus]|nr:hypothetical protein GCM10010381_02020 [Streptomyces xantholiticus]